MFCFYLGKRKESAYELSAVYHKAQYYEQDQMGSSLTPTISAGLKNPELDFMEQMGFGYKEMEEHGIGSPVLSVSCEYLSMTHFGDTVFVLPKIEIYTGTRLTLSYKVLDTEQKILRAKGSSRHCFLSSSSGRPVSLKRLLPEVHELFLEACLLEPEAFPFSGNES